MPYLGPKSRGAFFWLPISNAKSRLRHNRSGLTILDLFCKVWPIMSLFIQLFEKIEPIAKNEKAARELADVLVDAFRGKLDDYATKSDLSTAVAELKADLRSEINKQTWTLIGALGILGALFKFIH